MQAIHQACCNGSLQAQLTHVISNVPDAPGLLYAQQNNIKTSVVDHQQYNSREKFDQALLETIEIPRPPALIMLAGFMRKLTAGFTEQVHGRMINIHPSLLPAHPGLNTHRSAIDNGDRWHGCSVHFVNETLDGGPVIARGIVPVRSEDSAETLAARVLRSEHRLYPAVAQQCLHGGIRCQDSHVVINDTVLHTPLLYYY